MTPQHRTHRKFLRNLNGVGLWTVLCLLLGGLGVAEARPKPQPPAQPMTPTSSNASRHSRPPLARPPRVRRICTTPTQIAANYSGKYQGLARRLYVPRDCASYGDVSDYGHYTGHSYAGHQNLPAGYWVYHYPYWYIWRRRLPPAQHPRKRCKTPSRSPSVSGKYRTLLRVLHVPGDCASYGSFQDYGAYSATSYANYAQLPAGHWVYHYPHWYIWKSKTTATSVSLPSRACRTPKKPSSRAGGKYSRLLRRIRVPADCRSYGAYYDYGRYAGTTYAGLTNLPQGFWVYHYPHWYIWNKRRP